MAVEGAGRKNACCKAKYIGRAVGRNQQPAVTMECIINFILIIDMIAQLRVCTGARNHGMLQRLHVVYAELVTVSFWEKIAPAPK